MKLTDDSARELFAHVLQRVQSRAITKRRRRHLRAFRHHLPPRLVLIMQRPLHAFDQLPLRVRPTRRVQHLTRVIFRQLAQRRRRSSRRRVQNLRRRLRRRVLQSARQPLDRSHRALPRLVRVHRVFPRAFARARALFTAFPRRARRRLQRRHLQRRRAPPQRVHERLARVRVVPARARAVYQRVRVARRASRAPHRRGARPRERDARVVVAVVPSRLPARPRRERARVRAARGVDARVLEPLERVRDDVDGRHRDGAARWRRDVTRRRRRRSRHFATPRHERAQGARGAGDRPPRVRPARARRSRDAERATRGQSIRFLSRERFLSRPARARRRAR